MATRGSILNPSNHPIPGQTVSPDRPRWLRYAARCVSGSGGVAFSFAASMSLFEQSIRLNC